MPPDGHLERLLEAAREGDDVALGSLVKLTQPDVWRLCTALGSPGEVEDLVQETYVRAIRALTSYRGDAPARVWLLSIARRVCADHVRARDRERRLLRRLERSRPGTHPAPAEPVAHIVQALVVERREAFVLTQLLGLSYEEAALALGCPVGTIRSRVARARADLLETVGAERVRSSHRSPSSDGSTRRRSSPLG